MMAHPLFHAKSSAKKFGGKPSDYLFIHSWFDESKSYMGDVRHRALRHHAEGIFLCEKIFGISILNSDGRDVPVRFIGEQHVIEDLGRIPSASDWLGEMPIKPWMGPRSKLEVIEEELASDADESHVRVEESQGKKGMVSVTGRSIKKGESFVS